jgi:peptidyl-prolyl cis-trans isomerase SurA
MRKRSIIGCSVLLLAALPLLFAGDVIDRIVATVNGRIILQSDWDNELAYEAFINGKQAQQFSAEQRKAILDRLVDQQLLRQQMPDNDPQLEPGPEVVGAKLQEVRQQSGAETDQAWQALLARYNLSQDDVKSHVVMQVKVLRLVDEHLTSTIQIDDKSIEDYYNQTLLPQLRQKGVKEPPLPEVTPKIREILTQQKLNDALREWLQNLRDSSSIVVKDGAPAK